jgi:hypothetical protein
VGWIFSLIKQEKEIQMTIDKFVAIKLQIIALQEEADKMVWLALKDGFQKIFAKYPLLGKVSWVQYTSCVDMFCSSHRDPLISSVDYDNEGSNYWDRGLHPEDPHIEALKGAEKDVSLFLGCFDADDMKFMFDDHVRVALTRKGIEIDDYAHD